MMQIDGVADGLRGGRDALELSFGVELRKGDSVVSKLDLRESDGMCMGFHGWVEGDFGETPVLARRAEAKAASEHSTRRRPRR